MNTFAELEFITLLSDLQDINSKSNAVVYSHSDIAKLKKIFSAFLNYDNHFMIIFWIKMQVSTTLCNGHNLNLCLYL